MSTPNLPAAPATSSRVTPQTGRGGTLDYYSRKQLKHARNAALTALTWFAVCVLAVVYAWVTGH